MERGSTPRWGQSAPEPIPLIIKEKALPVFRGDGKGSGDQSADQCPEESFSSSACVVGELEEGEVDRQFFL